MSVRIIPEAQSKRLVAAPPRQTRRSVYRTSGRPYLARPSVWSQYVTSVAVVLMGESRRMSVRKGAI